MGSYVSSCVCSPRSALVEEVGLLCEKNGIQSPQRFVFKDCSFAEFCLGKVCIFWPCFDHVICDKETKISWKLFFTDESGDIDFITKIFFVREHFNRKHHLSFFFFITQSATAMDCFRRQQHFSRLPDGAASEQVACLLLHIQLPAVPLLVDQNVLLQTWLQAHKPDLSTVKHKVGAVLFNVLQFFVSFSFL